MPEDPAPPVCVLVVDDDPTFCTVMREILRHDGLDVHLAFDVPHALSTLEKTTPDLILTDVMMPEIDGLTLIRQLRTDPAWATTPIVVISARVLPEEQVAARKAGADAFVAKPFSFKELRTIIKSFSPQRGGLRPSPVGL